MQAKDDRSGTRPESGRATVLIADDVPALRAIVRRILERDGRFDVVAEAQDGIEAVELAARFQPRVVVLDVMMPRQDGIAALAEIRHVSPASKVVILTGCGTAPCSEVAADAWLDKGVSPRDMIKTVEGLAVTA